MLGSAHRLPFHRMPFRKFIQNRADFSRTVKAIKIQNTSLGKTASKLNQCSKFCIAQILSMC